ncbi:hypothetical protein M409DRAFT_20769 [Zasmidium cellare ATCC 36951]|uniref:Cytochrome b5 heme-binding domain-containing protein n=1 Tax=Zasmidium cellare ATCC 36951 TaxID=1080233 RepID=A0A6A6CNW5_ZASCE|nr:uncharacterized protein M409DRAFT_20769 [Zasmidium cellare ATCC 36951]KAF2168751.1 hypothetical protein M409DRAFT_20769 [Zasmidium cellare ATCC 36951]
MVTSADVRSHASRDSCWVIIDGNVYDVTDFLDHHPGGANTILRHAGKDATAEYEPVHPEGTLDAHLPKDKHLGPVDFTQERESEKAAPTPSIDKKPSGPKQNPLSVLQNLDDFEIEAQKVLPEKSWIYYSSATDTLSSHTNNRVAFSKVSLRPRVLRNVARISLQKTIMGFRSSLPVFIAPAALAKLGHPDGELCLTRGAARYNIPHCPSTYSSISHAELAKCLQSEQEAVGNKRGTLFFQLYAPINKREGALKHIADAKRLNFTALVVTVDSAVIGKREEDERYKARLDHDSGIVFQANSSPDPDPNLDRPVPRGAHSSTLEWDDLIWIREAWGKDRPVVLKGIATVEDVVEAAKRRVDGVYLSNHGGRQLDYVPSSLHTLLEIRLFHPELFDKLDIYVDGGFRRGTDVIKALCLGAKAVGLGRPFMYSLTGYGTGGVCRAIEILSDEIQTSMRLMGVTNVDQLDMSYVNTALLELEMPRLHNLRLQGKL